MSTRDSDAREREDEPTTMVRGNGNGHGHDSERSDTEDLSRFDGRQLQEHTYRKAVGAEELAGLTYNALQAHRVDDARRWREANRRGAVLEEGIFELVADSRARRAAEDALRKELGDHRTETRQSISEVRADLEKKVAEAKRVSLVDEKEREVLVELASVGVDAARDHVAVRTTVRKTEAELVTHEHADALTARKERRALTVAGLKKIAIIVVPILTTAAGVLAGLLTKGC